MQWDEIPARNGVFQIFDGFAEAMWFYASIEELPNRAGAVNWWHEHGKKQSAAASQNTAKS